MPATVRGPRLNDADEAPSRPRVFVGPGVVALLVPATILGLGIGPAVAMHEGSTLVVVVNALRLLAFKRRPVDGV